MAKAKNKPMSTDQAMFLELDAARRITALIEGIQSEWATLDVSYLANALDRVRNVIQTKDLKAAQVRVEALEAKLEEHLAEDEAKDQASQDE